MSTMITAPGCGEGGKEMMPVNRSIATCLYLPAVVTIIVVVVIN